MNATLPQVSAAITADLYDVHARLAATRKFSYYCTFFRNAFVRVFPWVHQFYPRWF